MIRFFVHNPVAANLLMGIFIISGGLAWWHTPKQLFPDVAPEKINVKIDYLGVGTQEIEKSVTRRVENALKKLTGVQQIDSIVSPGVSLTVLTLKYDTNGQELLQDVKNEIDAIGSDLPQNIKEPEIAKVARKIPVLSLVLSGEVSEKKLRQEALQVRDELLEYSSINEILLFGVRDQEIWIELTPEKLQEYDLTIAEVGNVLAEENLNLTGGELKSLGSYIQVKSVGEELTAFSLENKVIRTNSDGSFLFLKDIARVSEGFAPEKGEVRFSQSRACRLEIMKTAGEDVLQISAIIEDYLAKNSLRLAGAISIKVAKNNSRFVAQRLNLMWGNAWMGFLLVLFSLWVFLNFRVAFWVAMGIPIACLATFVGMQCFSVSINIMSLLGLILVLGMLVDDAVVVGENIFSQKQENSTWLESAITGTREVFVPVMAAVTTTIIAFSPLLLVSGTFGQWVSDIPKVVTLALAMSLVEVFFILPAHLGQSKNRKTFPWLTRLEIAKNEFFKTTLPLAFATKLKKLLRWRYLIIAFICGISLASISLVIGKKVPFVFVQKIDSEIVAVVIEMIPGTSRQKTREAVIEIENILGQYPEVINVVSMVGDAMNVNQYQHPSPTIADIIFELIPAEEREIRQMRTAQECARALQTQISPSAQLKSLDIEIVSGLPPVPDLEIQIVGKSSGAILETTLQIKELVQKYSAIHSVRDNIQNNQREVQIKLLPYAKTLGLTTSDLALEIRYALFGLEVQKLQDGDNEVTLRILFSEKDRAELLHLENLYITSLKGKVKIQEIASLSMTKANTIIRKIDGERTATVTANIDERKGNLAEITAELVEKIAHLEQTFPETSIHFGGKKKESKKSFDSLVVGFPIALFLIYAVIAIVFRSYTQPLIIMVAIPFSIVGAIWGHFLMGFPFTFMSIIGCVALAGIVVNDNLVLMDKVNQLRREGKEADEAVLTGTQKRLRAILLTTITTVAGLIPLLFDRSFQAATIVPMAISLAFGLIFATILTLVMVPALYLILEDMKTFWQKIFFQKGKE